MPQHETIDGIGEDALAALVARGAPVELRAEIVEGYEGWAIYTVEPAPRVKSLKTTTKPHVFRKTKLPLDLIARLGGIGVQLGIPPRVVAYHAETAQRMAIVDAALKAHGTNLSRLAKAKDYPFQKLQRTYINRSRLEEAQNILADLCERSVGDLWPQWPDTIVADGDGRFTRLTD